MSKVQNVKNQSIFALCQKYNMSQHRVQLKNMRKCRTKEEVTFKKKNTYMKLESLRDAKTWQGTWETQLALQKMVRNDLIERFSFKSHSCMNYDYALKGLRKENRDKKLRYDKSHKTWSENQWQQVIFGSNCIFWGGQERGTTADRVEAVS